MVPIAMKHYHITASNGVVRCISTAKFIAVKYDFIGIAQEGLSNVTTRTFLVGSNLGMGCVPFPYLYTTLGLKLLSVIVARGYESRISAMTRLGHEKSTIARS